MEVLLLGLVLLQLWCHSGAISVLDQFVGNQQNSSTEGKDLFPPNFKFGCATSSYQIEGAWNISDKLPHGRSERDEEWDNTLVQARREPTYPALYLSDVQPGLNPLDSIEVTGKGENVWDRMTHNNPGTIYDSSNGDISVDSYQFYKEDVRALKSMGMNYYRFSISWARVLPTGDISSINEAGIDYYVRLVDELVASGIEPMVTLYHWDLPQYLQDLGGFANPLIVNYFEEYSRLMFTRLGSKVKHWITFNEPMDLCVQSYTNLMAPLLNNHGVGEYICGKNLLLSHAKAFRLYDEHFRKEFGGKIGIALNSRWFEPNSNQYSDVEAAERALQFGLGWFAHPIFSPTGGYPPVMVERINANSQDENRRWSRLPVMDEITKKYIQVILPCSIVEAPDEAPTSTLAAQSLINLSNRFFTPIGYSSVGCKYLVVPLRMRWYSNIVKDNMLYHSSQYTNDLIGTSDFFGINHYSTRLATTGLSGDSPSWARDQEVLYLVDPDWPVAASDWIKVVPWGLRNHLRWIKNTYNNPEVIITENGFSDLGETNDTGRVRYICQYLIEVLKAIHEDGCNVTGYTVWSLLDNFEWFRGYSEHFGLFSVDLDDPLKQRRPKFSSSVMKEIIATRKIPEAYLNKVD